MRKEDAGRELGGMTGLLKAQAGIIFRECADTAMLLFGGNGYTRSGQGELIESKSNSPNPLTQYPHVESETSLCVGSCMC
jgi:hypothetical protein